MLFATLGCLLSSRAQVANVEYTWHEATYVNVESLDTFKSEFDKVCFNYRYLMELHKQGKLHCAQGSFRELLKKQAELIAIAIQGDVTHQVCDRQLNCMSFFNGRDEGDAFDFHVVEPLGKFDSLYMRAMKNFDAGKFAAQKDIAAGNFKSCEELLVPVAAFYDEYEKELRRNIDESEIQALTQKFLEGIDI